MSICGGWAITKERKNPSRVQQTEHPLPTPQADTRIITIICVCVFQMASCHIPPPFKRGERTNKIFQALKNLTHKGWKDEQDHSILESLTHVG